MKKLILALLLLATPALAQGSNTQITYEITADGTIFESTVTTFTNNGVTTQSLPLRVPYTPGGTPPPDATGAALAQMLWTPAVVTAYNAKMVAAAAANKP